MRYFQFIFSWFKMRRASSALRTALEWERRATKIYGRIENIKDELQILQDELQGQIKKFDYEMTQVESLKGQYETALEQLRSENKVLTETTVPTLVAQHRLILKRIDAETANQVRLIVAASGREE